MGFFDRLKTGGAKASDNKTSKEVNTIKRALSSNGRIPEVKLSKNISLPINSYTSRCNANVLIFGGDDDDKRTKHIEPNILACDRNYVIADKDITLYSKYREQLESKGFIVKHIDLNDTVMTDYNPLGYVYDEQSARQLSEGITDNFLDGTVRGVKGIWELAEQSLLFAVIWAISETKEAASLSDVADIFKAGMVGLDNLFSNAKISALNEYKEFKQNMSLETQKGVVLSLAEKLKPLESWKISTSFSECMSEAREFVFGKKAVFISMPNDGKGIILASTIIGLMIRAIIGQMQTKGILRMQYPLHFMLNSMDITGKIHDFDQILSDAISHTFAFSLFAPSIASISDVYGDESDSVKGQCDTVMYLGKADFGTVEWISMEYVEDSDGNKIAVPDEETLNTAKGLCDDKVFLRINGFKPVTDGDCAGSQNNGLVS